MPIREPDMRLRWGTMGRVASGNDGRAGGREWARGVGENARAFPSPVRQRGRGEGPARRRQSRCARRRFQGVRRQNARGGAARRAKSQWAGGGATPSLGAGRRRPRRARGPPGGGRAAGAVFRRVGLFSTACETICRRADAERQARQAAAAIPGRVKSRQRRRQVWSSPVKFRQVASRPVKALLDGACRDFNGLAGKSPTCAPKPEPGRPATPAPLAGDEGRIAPLSAPAKTLSLSRGGGPHFFSRGKRLAGSAVDLLEALFFRGSEPVNGARSARRLRIGPYQVHLPILPSQA